jgi:hypothetical protein
LSDPRFDLGVAVGTEQDALARLGSGAFQGASDAHVAEAKALVERIDVMERESTDVTVVAAEGASTSGILNEGVLDLLAPSSDGLGSATKAAPAPLVTSPDELRRSVLRAFAERQSTVVGVAGYGSSRATRLKPVLPKPVADGRAAELEPTRYVADAEAFVDKSGQSVAVDAAAGSVDGDVYRTEAMASCPVRDR